MRERITDERRRQHPITCAVYDFLAGYIRQHQYPPTLREICLGVNLGSVSTAHRHLRTLQGWGAILVVDGSPRAIRVLRRKRVHHEDSL